MNEMIEVRKKPREYVWDINKKFNTLKGKLRYPNSDMKHIQLCINSMLPHFKYPLRQQKIETHVEELQETMHLEENYYKKTDPTIERMKEDLKNMIMQLN
jgi:hypothetical protein